MSNRNTKSGTTPVAVEPAADVDLSELDAEFAAYQQDAGEEQAKQDDTDPFGAALGHAILQTGKANKGFTRGSRFREDSVPASIRKFIDRSVSEFYADEIDGAKMKADTPKYRVVPFATAEDAQTFVKHAKRYGLHRPAGKLSVRIYPVPGEPAKVKVAAMPFQARGPKSKTAAPVADKPAETLAGF